jgi:two-component system LytT family response regulator
VSLRVLVVDDEPLARRRIRRLLRAERDVEIVGECGDGPQALDAIHRHRPDLIFLDVQMPEMDGFEVLEAVDPARLPAVVFVTAFDEHAIHAFEVHALDYLLKPFTAERFAEAVRRAREAAAGGASARRLAALLDAVRPRRRRLDRILVSARGRSILIRTSEIEWIEAEGNYARLHAAGAAHLIRETIARFEEALDPAQFARIHRSILVNLDALAAVEPWSHGDAVAVLKSGRRLRVSRTYRDRLREIWREEG